MLEMDFFRRCPKCGRMFQVKLVGKTTLSLERESAWVRRDLRSREPDTPLILDHMEVQYNYKCKSCGHEWSEKRAEIHKES